MSCLIQIFWTFDFGNIVVDHWDFCLGTLTVHYTVSKYLQDKPNRLPNTEHR